MSGIPSSAMAVTGTETIRTGLIGRDILASRSPWIHQQEAAAQGLSLRYDLFDFAANGWAEDHLAAQLDALRADGFAGVNVTHPFKQHIIPLLNSLAPSAASVGAVNTVHFANGKSVGHNTDVTGFAESVRRGLPGESLANVVQFGAGGAGSATAHALLGLGTESLTIADTDQDRRERLASQLRKSFPLAQVVATDSSAAALAAADGIVNATPVGMASYPGTPFDASALTPDQWVADIVYFPLETELLRQARARGCRTLDGKGMAVFQAADALDLFTGISADRARMLESFDAFVAQ